MAEVEPTILDRIKYEIKPPHALESLINWRFNPNAPFFPSMKKGRGGLNFSFNLSKIMFVVTSCVIFLIANMQFCAIASLMDMLVSLFHTCSVTTVAVERA